MVDGCPENLVTVFSSGQEQSSYDNIDDLCGIIRSLLRDAGCGKRDPGAPFKDIVEEGMTVLLKPNWVAHKNFGGYGNECLVTHPNLITAALKEILKAKPGRVIIGDAPVQLCDFDGVAPESWRKELNKIADCPVEVIDFRRTVLRPGGLVEGQDTNVRSDAHYILFDLGRDSLLDPVSTPDSRFRITCYDPDQLKKHHLPGKHEYLLCREPFEADVVISLPKLKTHKKAGLTAALKNIVGINGNKEYLPHHRIGGSARGGDCYPGDSPVKKMAERCLDEANRSIGAERCAKWLKYSDLLLKIQGIVGNPEIEGGWHGNDTVWRMTLDLNRLLLYGRPDGTISDSPQRKVYSLVDAIVAGEGDGPLAPRPVLLGALTFACSSAFADLVHAALMRFDFRKIPTVREAFGNFRYPLTGLAPEDCRIVCNGREISPEELSRDFGGNFAASSGWRGHIEKTAES